MLMEGAKLIGQQKQKLIQLLGQVKQSEFGAKAEFR